MNNLLKYSFFINESKERQDRTALKGVSFKYKGNELSFEGKSGRDTYDKIMKWLYEIGFFENNPLDDYMSHKVYTLDELDELKKEKGYLDKDRIRKIDGSDYWYIRNFSSSGFEMNIRQKLNNVEGIDQNSIEFKVVDESGVSTDDTERLPSRKENIDDTKLEKDYTTLKEVSFLYDNEKIVFSGNSGRDIYGKIINWLYKNNLIDIKNITTYTSKELDELRKIGKPIYIKRLRKLEGTDIWFMANYNIRNFKNIITNILENIPNIDNNSIDFDIIGGKKDIEEVTSKVDTPSDVKKDLVEPEDAVKNPFMQAICVIGASGAGKSFTVSKVLTNDNHNFSYIIPTATTTNLLSQYNPNKNRYVRSRLGEMIMEAINNPSQYYTAIFDEFHKSNTIEMINDELLQCISIHRNDGNRFISLDKSTIKLYRIKEKDESKYYEVRDIPFKTFHGVYNLVLPDNFGFIFISSKEKVVANNADFFNRVDVVRLTRDDWGMETAEDLLAKKLSPEEKREMSSDYDE